MPDNFDGSTFVAFADISGFKNFVKLEKAKEVLEAFYETGYSALANSGEVQGILVSDCAILFCAKQETAIGVQLKELLKIVEILHVEMIKREVMISTSIAYGDFNYQARREHAGVSKNLTYGNAYLAAYLDQSKGRPPLEPGRCRIVKDDASSAIRDLRFADIDPRLRNGKKHVEFYWMCGSDEEIEIFEAKYKDAYNAKFGAMRVAIQDSLKQKQSES